MTTNVHQSDHEDSSPSDEDPPNDEARLLEFRLALAATLDNSSGAPDNARLRAMYALAGVLEHLGEIGIAERLQSPILDLYKALDDVERGAATPAIFSGEKPGHRPPASNDDELVRVLAATGMALFMQAGENKADAARLVARRMAHSGLPLPDDFSAVTVANWRDRIHREHRSWAAERHRKALEAVKEVGADPRAAAESILSETSPMGAKKPR